MLPSNHLLPMYNPTPTQLRRKQISLWRAASLPLPMCVLYGGIFLTIGVGSLIVYCLRGVITPSGPLSTTMLGAVASTPGASLSTILIDRVAPGAFIIAFAAFWPRIFAEATSRFRVRAQSALPHPRRKPSRRLRLAHAGFLAFNLLMPLTIVPLWGYAAISSQDAQGWSIVATLSLIYLAWLLIALSTLRLGTGRRCSRCGYRMVSLRQSRDVCPECGGHWKRLGGTVYGHRLPRALMYVGFVLLAAAAGVWAFVPV